MTNYYEKSKIIFINKIKENNELTKKEWDNYAKRTCLFSSNTLAFHNDVNSFEELKKKLS